MSRRSIINRRLVSLFIIFIIVFAVILGHLAWIQLVQGDELEKRAAEWRVRKAALEAERGIIMDRNGRKLAINIEAVSIYAVPKEIDNIRSAARGLSRVLDNREESELYEKLKENNSFVWIERKAVPEKGDEIKNLNIEGVYSIESTKRNYINDKLASHVLGFVGVDNEGLTGLEKSYDEELRGKPGEIVAGYDVKGRKVPGSTRSYEKPVDGDNLVLTLDSTIQYIVSKKLDKAMEKYEPKLAVSVVMKPRTGEILAMESRPGYNPNSWQKYPEEIWGNNPAVWYNFEPGSTFKIVTAASALESSAIDPGDKFNDPGYVDVMGRKINCWQSWGHGEQTFTEIVQNSCNPGFVKVGLELGKKRFYRYIRDFGFGRETGINLPGEASGMLIPEDEATDLNIASMSIGQSLAVTPLQLINAVSAVANGGKLMKPRIVKQVIGEGGDVVRKNEPEVVREVISRETTQILTGALEKVVQQGTGKKASIDGFNVAGKTGTAQVVGDRGYKEGKYVASFAGYVPAGDPELAVLVMIAEPEGEDYEGGKVAAPVFREIAEESLNYLNIAPSDEGDEDKLNEENEGQAGIKGDEEKNAVPQVKYYPADKAEEVLKEKGFKISLEGSGSIVAEQDPGSGEKAREGAEINLILKPAETGEDKVIVPRVTGMTIKEAGKVLQEKDLLLSAEGSGTAAEQSVQPGKEVVKGTKIEVTFSRR